MLDEKASGRQEASGYAVCISEITIQTCANAGHKFVPDTYDDTSPNACPSIRSLARGGVFRLIAANTP